MAVEEPGGAGCTGGWSLLREGVQTAQHTLLYVWRHHRGGEGSHFLSKRCVWASEWEGESVCLALTDRPTGGRCDGCQRGETGEMAGSRGARTWVGVRGCA